MSAKQKTRSTGHATRRAQPDNTEPIRGWRCCREFEHFSEVVSPRLRFFHERFESGKRLTKPDACEWDFRGIGSLAEAHEALLWEYAREVEWVCDYHAGFLSLLSFKEGSRDHASISYTFRRMWCASQNTGSPDPLFEQYSRAMLHFPRPWLSLPEDERQPPKIQTGTGVHSLSPEEFEIRRHWRGHYRSHALEIDWSLSQTMLEEAVKEWLKTNRPSDVDPGPTRRGRREHAPFEKLKWLAAYRLANSGLSRKRAFELRDAHKAETTLIDVHEVLPRFASEGAWSTAIVKARKLIVDCFPDPRRTGGI